MKNRFEAAVEEKIEATICKLLPLLEEFESAEGKEETLARVISVLDDAGDLVVAMIRKNNPDFREMFAAILARHVEVEEKESEMAKTITDCVNGEGNPLSEPTEAPDNIQCVEDIMHNKNDDRTGQKLEQNIIRDSIFKEELQRHIQTSNFIVDHIQNNTCRETLSIELKEKLRYARDSVSKCTINNLIGAYLSIRSEYEFLIKNQYGFPAAKPMILYACDKDCGMKEVVFINRKTSSKVDNNNNNGDKDEIAN